LVLFLWVSSKKLKLLMSLGLWIVWIEIVSIVHCFMQASATRHCRSTLSRKKKTFYLTHIITYIICCLPTPKCRHTQSYPSSSSVPLGTHQFHKPRKSCRADQQSCVCYKLAKLYRNRTQKAKREWKGDWEYKCPRCFKTFRVREEAHDVPLLMPKADTWKQRLHYRA
jgi:hypothetical protein